MQFKKNLKNYTKNTTFYCTWKKSFITPKIHRQNIVFNKTIHKKKINMFIFKNMNMFENGRKKYYLKEKLEIFIDILYN